VKIFYFPTGEQLPLHLKKKKKSILEHSLEHSRCRINICRLKFINFMVKSVGSGVT
jgi:hypothetical protein